MDSDNSYSREATTGATRHRNTCRRVATGNLNGAATWDLRPRLSHAVASRLIRASPKPAGIRALESESRLRSIWKSWRR